MEKRCLDAGTLRNLADAGCDPDAKSSSRPSYKAMAQMAMEDDRVRIQLANDRLSAAQADFGDTLPEEAENADAWKAKLRLTEKGALQQSIENVVVLLENDPRLKNSIALNEMDHNIVLRRSVPWRSIGKPCQWTRTTPRCGIIWKNAMASAARIKSSTRSTSRPCGTASTRCGNTWKAASGTACRARRRC